MCFQMNHDFVCHTLMIVPASGGAAARDCTTLSLCIAIPVLHLVLWLMVLLDFITASHNMHCWYTQQPPLHVWGFVSLLTSLFSRLACGQFSRGQCDTANGTYRSTILPCPSDCSATLARRSTDLLPIDHMLWMIGKLLGTHSPPTTTSDELCLM